jgi:hypothetical protein
MARVGTNGRSARDPAWPIRVRRVIDSECAALQQPGLLATTRGGLCVAITPGHGSFATSRIARLTCCCFFATPRHASSTPQRLARQAQCARGLVPETHQGRYVDDPLACAAALPPQNPLKRLRDPHRTNSVAQFRQNIAMGSNVLPVPKPPVLSSRVAALLSVRFKLAPPTTMAILLTQ